LGFVNISDPLFHLDEISRKKEKKMKYVIKFALVAMALMLGIKAWGQQAATSVSPRNSIWRKIISSPAIVFP